MSSLVICQASFAAKLDPDRRHAAINACVSLPGAATFCALKAAGAGTIFREKVSGAPT
jgi:hypothetical protein